MADNEIFINLTVLKIYGFDLDFSTTSEIFAQSNGRRLRRGFLRFYQQHLSSISNYVVNRIELEVSSSLLEMCKLCTILFVPVYQY